MRLLGKNVLHDFKEAHADARSDIESWEAEVEEAQWKTPHELRNCYPKASIIGAGNVVFDITGNKYRLWAIITYKTAVVLVKKLGNHNEYESWKIKK